MTIIPDPRIGATVDDSEAWWDPPATPAENAPNIIVAVFDDTGWSDFGCFGSEIRTPVIDALAAAGTRFNNFHVTPLCSPTRASLLTGKNHHSVGMRFLAVGDSGFPNARGQLPADVQTVPGVLRDRGYGTYLVGKWHLAPQDELGPAGPYRNWPLARGFERFYGFLGGASDQYLPELYRDNSPVEPSTDPGYHLSADLVDQSIGLIRDHIAYRDDQPFFLQIAFGATHAPFQAPAEWIDGYRGQYDQGWDQLREQRLARQRDLGIVPEHTRLTERDPDVPAWDGLTAAQRALAARGQEAFAGFLEHTDSQLGRLIDWLREIGQLDNTLIAVFSDNGAAGDGGDLGTTNVIGTYNNLSLTAQSEKDGLEHVGDRTHPAHYAAGWAMAGNTPFRLYKQYVDLGGTRSPLVIRWPGSAPAGVVRAEFAHVIDLAATLVDSAVAANDPHRDEVFAQLHGASLRGVLTGSEAPRATQHFEMLGHRAIWSDGWRAVTRHRKGDSYDADRWRLYHVTRDFAETIDLAADHPDKLQHMIRLWWTEADRHGALPLDDRTLKELLEKRAPGAKPMKTKLVLRPNQSHLGFTTRLTGTDRTMRVEARLDRSGDESGVLLASGAGYGGYVLYIDDNVLHFEHHLLDEHVQVHSDVPVPAGASVVGFHLSRTAGRSAQVELLVNDRRVGWARIPTTSMQLAFFGLDVGRDRSRQVSASYREQEHFPFPAAALRDVTVLYDHAAESPKQLSHHLEANQ